MEQERSRGTESFTESQLANWKAYERVRKGGKYNMFDPRARRATKLSHDEYMFCLKYYSELQEAVRRSVGKVTP